MPRYERIEGSAQRFWEIEVDGRFVTTRWGRLGRQPQSRTVSCADETDAKRRRDTLIRQKLAKGYERVGDELVAPRTGAGNPELEAALAADPDDLETRLVYADWLMSQEATLGELIALEVEHARTGDDGLLSRIARLRAQCVGEVADRRTVQLSWRLGLVRRARLPVMGTGRALLGTFLPLPAARVLHALRLDVEGSHGSPGDRATMLRAVVELAPRFLRQLELDYRPDPSFPEVFADDEGWWDGLDTLDTLLVKSSQASLPVPTDRLRVFGFDAQDVPWHPTVVRPWARLEHLVLARVPATTATQLLTTLVAPALHTVALHHLDVESIPWRHVLNGPVGPTLRTIELVGPVPWTLRSVLDRLGDRVRVRWCGGPAPDPELRSENAPWLEVSQVPRYSVPW
ncbi:MAG: WGR domain-containing protein [Myxococcota bacterium]